MPFLNVKETEIRQRQRVGMAMMLRTLLILKKNYGSSVTFEQYKIPESYRRLSFINP
jgi:hypothetical protein